MEASKCIENPRRDYVAPSVSGEVKNWGTPSDLGVGMRAEGGIVRAHDHAAIPTHATHSIFDRIDGRRNSVVVYTC